MIVGARVEQRIQVQTDGELKWEVRLAGIVVACERAGQPAVWSTLVMKDDGALVSILAEHLTVVALPGGKKISRDK